MAKITQTFIDAKGNPHQTPEAATKSDLLLVMGNPALADHVFRERARIEQIFAEHDAMTKAVQPIKLADRRAKATNG